MSFSLPVKALRYYFFAGLAAVFDFISFIVALELGIEIVAASSVSTALGILLGYTLISRFVFKVGGNTVHFRRYLLVAICVIGLATIAIPLFSELLELDWLAKMLWMAVQALLQYQVHKKWTFRS